MPIYTVTAVNGTTPKSGGKFGDMQDVSIDLSDGSQTFRGCSWYTKATTQLPSQGDQLEGDITEDPQWGLKFKKAYNAQIGYNGGGGSGSSAPRGGMTPDREKKIVRQHSQNMAIAYVAATDLKLPGGIEDLVKIIDWFDTDVFGTESTMTLEQLVATTPVDAPAETDKIPF